MAEAQYESRYPSPTTTPKKRVVSSTRTPDNRGTMDRFNQYNASTRTGAFAPASTYPSASTTAPTRQGGTVTPTASTYPNPQGQVAAASSSGSGSAPASESLYGFAGKHFTPGTLPMVWENPWMIVNAALEDRGLGQSPLKEMMRQYGELGLPIFTMLKGLTGDTGDLGSSETINWISRWINSMTRTNGSVPTYEGLLGQLLQGRGTDTILGEALNSGTAQDQVNTLMTYLRAALGTNSMNPIAASAVLSQANREGDEFLQRSAMGQDGYTRNFTDWINSGGHRLFGDERYR